jgi:hypothetical protein
MTDDSAMTLALPFDTDQPEFRRGVEIGMLWQQLQMQPFGPVEATLHADCTEMVIRIAEAACLPFAAEDGGDGWIHVVIGATGGIWTAGEFGA